MASELVMSIGFVDVEVRLAERECLSLFAVNVPRAKPRRKTMKKEVKYFHCRIVFKIRTVFHRERWGQGVMPVSTAENSRYQR